MAAVTIFIIFKLLMTSFKMLLFLFFLYLIKYPQRNINMSHYVIYFLFSYISSDFCFRCLMVYKCLMVYDVYLLCELYFLSLIIFILLQKQSKIKVCLKEDLLYHFRTIWISYFGYICFHILES